MAQSNIPAAGGKSLIAKSIADIAADINRFSAAVVPAGMMDGWAAGLSASIFNDTALTAAKGASILDSTNLTAAKGASIFNETALTVANLISILDNNNISSAKIKSIFETGLLTVDEKRAAVLEGNQYATVDAADSVNGTFYTDDQLALAFDNVNLTAARGASIFNDTNLIAARGASIFNDTNLTVARCASIFNETALSITKINDIIIHANITDSRAQQILSEITKTDRDLTSAANIYEILDDWNDNKITARDGAETTPTGFTNLFAQKDKFRPVWSGGTASDGNLKMTGADQKEYCASTFTTGTWEVGYYVDGTGNYRDGILYNMYVDANNWYMLDDDHGHVHFNFIKNVNTYSTTIIENDSTGLDQAWITMKITRDGSGHFEIFYQGASKGTVTDTSITTSARLYVGCGNQVATYFDNLKVY